MFNEVYNSTIDLSTLDGVNNKGPTVGIYTGSGVTDIVVVLMHDEDSKTTTFVAPLKGAFLPIAIKRWVSGPADAIGFTVR